ncbi:MAG: SHOCT domain-containing protein [Anaerolineae bacterium]
MGRILLVLGVLMVIGGIVGMATSSFLPSNFGATLQMATDPAAREAKLCQPGEKLIEENGGTTYTPGQGYASTAILYCENNEGQRREVTGEFANQLLGQVGDVVSNVFGGLGRTFMFVGLMMVGIVFIIIGSIANMRRRVMRDAFGNPLVGQSFSGATTVNVGGKDVTTTPEVARYLQRAQVVHTSTPSINVVSTSEAGGDLKSRLSQLEEARKAGLLSQEEFDRLRQQILDTLK